MNNIVNLIVSSNLFNFTIFVLILIYIAKKFDIPAFLEKLKTEIQNTIDSSKTAKQKAERELKDAEISLKNAAKEIEKVLSETKLNAENIENKILKDTNSKIETMKINTQKALDAEEKRLCNLLTTVQGQKAVEIAQENIVNILKDNPDLHKNYLENSIQEIEKAVII